MEKVLNSAMANEELEKMAQRKNDIVDQVAEKRAAFESADVETRDAFLGEIETLTKEAEQLETDIAEMTETRDRLKEQEERMSMINSLNKENIDFRNEERSEKPFATKEYAQMYADVIRDKEGAKETLNKYVAEKRAASLYTGLTNIPVPEIMQGFVETAWYTYGKFSRLVSETFEAGILRIPVETAADGANWHDENDDAPDQETITLGQVVLQPKTIKKWISLTDELMAMAAPDFLRYVADELVYKIILALDEAIITRTDANGAGVIGIVGNANAQTYASTLGFNVINEAIAQLVTFEDLTIAMNPSTFFNNFMGLTDQVGNPIFRIVHDNEGRPQYFLSGHRVEFTQALKPYDEASSGEAYAVVGNFRRGYRLNYPAGRDVITLVDPYTLSTEDIVRMIGRLLVAGNVVKPAHFAVLTKGTASV